MTGISITADLGDAPALQKAAETFTALAEDALRTPSTADDADRDIEHRSGHEVPSKPPGSSEAVLDGSGGVVLDAEGLPWDARIHSDSRKMLKKEGTWKLTRGVAPALVASVKAELRAAMAVPAPDVTVHNVDAHKAAGTQAPAPSPAKAPAPTAATTPAPPPAKKPEPEPVLLYLIDGEGFTREQLIEAKWSEAAIDELASEFEESAPVAATFPAILAKIAESGVDDVAIAAALQNVGLASVEMLAARPDLIPDFHDALFQ